MRIPPEQVTEFLKSRGWIARPLADFPQLLVFENPNFPRRQLSVPSLESAADYEDALTSLLNKLSVLERRTAPSLQNELELTNSQSAPEGSDTFELRMLATSDDDQGIPLSLARTAISETESMLMVSSCQAESPAKHFKRIDNSVSNKIRELARFNHTRRGSFVMTVSLPVVPRGEQYPLDSATTPTHTRRAFLALQKSLQLVSHAIAANTVVQLSEEIKQATRPEVSSNFCQSLASMIEVTGGNGITLDFQWSNLLPPLREVIAAPPISFKSDAAEKIYDLSMYLRPLEYDQEDRFVGTVDALRGGIDQNGERAGRVDFSILLKDGTTVKATAILSVAQYKLADEAHIAGEKYVEIVGRLESKPRMWQFVSVRDITLR